MRRVIALGAAVAASSVLVAGCGGGGGSADAPPSATAPTSAATPVAVSAVALGGTVSAGPATPKPVARALAGSGVVVVSFVLKGAADDDSVAAAVAAVRADPRSSTGVAFFDYTVGADAFGDLADRLGITGTPSIAVIGRDRTLVNLWTGLVDADTLRQSIADAADTVAAHPGARAASTSSATAPTGNAEGIALAEKINTSYAELAGVKVTGSFPVKGAGTVKVDAVMSLGKGAITGTSGTFELAGTKFEIAVSPGTARIRSGDATCWANLPGGSLPAADTPQPAVTFAGTRVAKPRTQDGSTLLDVTTGGQTLTYVIDPDTLRVTAVRTSVGTIGFEALDTTPSIPAGTPVCDNPAEALKGLPSSLGGTS